MSRPNTMFIEPPESGEEAALPAPELEATPSPLLSGAELLIGQISESLTRGQNACAMLQEARFAGDTAATRAAADQLAAALRVDPKALARRVAVMVRA